MTTEQGKAKLQINMQRVEELMSALTLRPTMALRFRFNLSTQDTLDLLTAAYKYEVQKRLRRFILDDNTESNLIRLAEYLTQAEPKFGVMCSGTCGNGKTTLLYAFQRVVNYLQDHSHFSFLDSGNQRFIAQIEIFRSKELAQISREQKRFKTIIQRPMLAIDELGAEPAEVYDYQNINTPVIDVIDYRYNHQLFTFITTNLSPQEIRVKYGTRIADRFNEMLHVIAFKDRSYRENPNPLPLK